MSRASRRNRSWAPPRAVMEIAGSYDKEVWNATITTTELTTGDQRTAARRLPEPRDSRSRRATAHRSSNLCLVVGAGRMCAEGKWQRGGAVGRHGLRLRDSARCRAAAERRRSARYAGRIEGRVHAFGAARPAVARRRPACASSTPRSSTDRPARSRRRCNLGTGGLAATATPERINFSFGVQAFTDTFLYANAPAAARRPQRHPEPAADRRYARARRGREHPAAGVSGDRSTPPAC